MDTSRLEARIAQAEQAVIERDRRVRMYGRSLATAVETRLARLRGPGLFSAVVALFLPGPGRERSGTARGLSWAALIPFLWPWMPAAVRRRMSATTATLIVGMAAPALARLRPQREPVKTVDAVDLARFAGRWYELARLPAIFDGGCARDATTTYTLHRRHIEIDNRCRLPSGRERRAVGVVLPVAGGGGARLEVSLFPPWLRWLPFAWGGHWVIALDRDYQTAVVGTPERRGLWLLARTPVVDETTYQGMVARAAGQGYDVARLKRVQHRGGAGAASFTPEKP